MQFLELYTRVGEILEDTSNAQWTLALIKQYLNDAAREFARDTKVYKLKSAALTAAATTPTHAYYTLPTDLLEIEHVTNDGDFLPLVTAAQLPDRWDTETGDTPTFALLGDEVMTTIRVYPYPDTTALDALKVWYAALPPTMTQTTDAPTGIPAIYHIALVYYAVAMCYRRNFEDADKAKVAEYMGLYQREVLDCSARTARRFTSQAVTVPYRHF